MTLDDLIIRARRLADDTVQPYLWNNGEWTDYANDAVRDAVIRTRCLRDDATGEICQIDVVAGSRDYALDARVIDVIGARLGDIVLSPLHAINAAGLHTRTGTPGYFLTDAVTGYVTLYPQPVATGTLYLTVHRLPLKGLDDGEDTPELPALFHDDLVYGMLARAYQKNDADTGNLQRAQYFQQLFDAAFGYNPTHHAQTQRRFGVARAVSGRYL